jgi:hypothetical protein
MVLGNPRPYPIYIYIYIYIYILEYNPQPFCSFRKLKSRPDSIRGRELDFGKIMEPLYVP